MAGLNCLFKVRDGNFMFVRRLLSFCCNARTHDYGLDSTWSQNCLYDILNASRFVILEHALAAVRPQHP